MVPFPKATTPRAVANMASPPLPSINPEVLLDNNVVELEFRVNIRSGDAAPLWVMKTFPVDTCKPFGVLNLEFVPMPSKVPEVPLPAKVVTPDGEIRRTRLLPPSATSKFPGLITTIPLIVVLNLAANGFALSKYEAGDPPATDETDMFPKLLTLTTRTRKFCKKNNQE